MTKRRVDLLILNSAQTVMAESSNNQDIGVVDNGGVAVDAGSIVEVGSSQLLERKFLSSRMIDASDQLILPGLIDPHTHLVFAGSREQEFQARISGANYIDILRKGGGILETVAKTRQSTEESLVQIAKERTRKMLERGTTTVEIKSGYGLRTYDEMKMLRVIRKLQNSLPSRIIPTFLGAHAIPTEYSEDEYTKVIIEEMLPAVGRSKLARFCDVFCERGAFGYASSKRILKAAVRTGLKTKIHADQFSDSGGTRLANEIHATSADHLVNSASDQLRRMPTSSVTPVLLPGSSESLLSTNVAPANEMISYGLPVALGTDFSPSNWLFSQLTVAALASRKLRMRAENVIRGITINAARAVGLEKRIGSLQPGKSADMVVLNAENYKTIGYSYGEELVDKVLIAGRIVVDSGRMTG